MMLGKPYPDLKLRTLLRQINNLMKPHIVYAVGGCVRDTLLNILPKDYDFCTSASPDEIEQCIRMAGRKPFLVGKRFGTIGCKIEIESNIFEQVEITTFRAEKYSEANRKPDVEFVTSINEDLSRRDFTINAMAIRLDNENLRLIDPFQGSKDLQNRIISCVGCAKSRFKEDPLRILRAIRFSNRFGFQYEEKTKKAICSEADKLLDISKERWVMELDNILIGNSVGLALLELWKFRIFNYILPELSLQYNYDQNSQYHNFLLHEHTIKVVEACPNDLDLRWGALLHDIAKPYCRTDKKVVYEMETLDGSFPIDGYEIKSNYISHEVLGADMALKIARHLNFSNERTKRIVYLIKNHLKEDCELRQYDNLGKK